MTRVILAALSLIMLSSTSISAELRYGAVVSVYLADGGVSADGTIDKYKLWAVGTPFGMNTRGFVLNGRLVAKSGKDSVPLGEFNCAVGDIVASVSQTYNIGQSCNVSPLAKLPAGSKLYAETGFRLAQDTAYQQLTSTFLRNVQLRTMPKQTNCESLPKPGPRKVKGQNLEVRGFILDAVKGEKTNGWQRFCLMVTARGAGVNQPNFFGALYAGPHAKRSWIGSFRCAVTNTELLQTDSSFAIGLYSCNYAPTPLANLRPGEKIYARVGVTFDQRPERYTQTRLVKPYPNGLK